MNKIDPQGADDDIIYSIYHRYKRALNTSVKGVLHYASLADLRVFIIKFPPFIYKTESVCDVLFVKVHLVSSLG